MFSFFVLEVMCVIKICKVTIKSQHFKNDFSLLSDISVWLLLSHSSSQKSRKAGQVGVTLILCKESWGVLWALFSHQGGHEYRGGRQFLNFLISLAYPDQLRLNPPRPEKNSQASWDAAFRWTSLCVCAYSVSILCDQMDCSPPGSCVLGISQARILEWVVISFSVDGLQRGPLACTVAPLPRKR